ncbi:hypothetical protein COEREDRAFT_90470 [Coemansia reversa NRRL 1564]|uniref:Uncharacterized protein n=1 Tax=Coemansia reversa (strain ATCC 12441 / NRRL 1564) TaxID=763665 RepID=A0A2G5BJC6_COERN|nr:hypothetical protein COEREDRAFT_90470 [Coemansia reversa NRRL 1564]|eukprot:PIA19103.1 hypothetical protein COEREDRAFT_90470 [Coemansia reversa NRRL 1564]
MLEGKKVDRNELFDDGDGYKSDAMEAETQVKEQYEAIMSSRLAIESGTQQSGSSTSQDADVLSVSDTPVFRMFAGSGPVKVATETAEPVYILPEQPEVDLEESDSEEHWNALASVALDADAVMAMAQIPLPAMQYPKRVVYVKPDSAAVIKESEASNKKNQKSCRRRSRTQRHKKTTGSSAAIPYVRVLSPYNGGLLKGEMLEDVIRREEAKERRAASIAQSGRVSGGFRGRGRGRGLGRGRGFAPRI